ncbi:hypothetical protein PI95_028095 [Hassallia byssoidea VB512170]|uniref:Uncharacterized protein n=1 Tax=Hassallia byssoidea VB512170 TaxID=1304833 RepID=A0A846HG31_9CYAN|nr:hypothetical protein [Hassalia byssoidea]NEU76285.1 hypothetical protein [Hassalia byssoidea VB512170]
MGNAAIALYRQTSPKSNFASGVQTQSCFSAGMTRSYKPTFRRCDRTPPTNLTPKSNFASNAYMQSGKS